MAAVRGTYVDPDGTGDYASLDLWEDDFGGVGNSGDCVAEDEIARPTCLCTGGTADTSGVVVAGWTSTSATQYIDILVGSAYRHNMKYATGNIYRIEVTNAIALQVQENHVRVSGILFRATFSNSATGAVVFSNGSGGGEDHRFKDLVIQAVDGGGASGLKYGFQTGLNSTLCKLSNSVIYDFVVAGATSAAVRATSTTGGDLYIFNCTIHNAQYGLYDDDTSITARNVLVQTCSNPFIGLAYGSHNIGEIVPAAAVCFGDQWESGTATSTVANKLVDSTAAFITAGVQVGSVVKNSTDTTYAYVTAVDNETTLSLSSDIFVSGESHIVHKNMVGVVTFVDETGDDFHLAAADTVARNKGKNLSENVNLAITVDIDGQTRVGTFDVGADEFYAAPTITLTTVDTGGTGDYASLDLWEDDFGGVGNSGDCEGENEIARARCICTDGNDDTTAVIIAGWTSTNANCYLDIYSDTSYRHSFVWPTAGLIYRLNVAGTCINVQESHVHLTGLAIRVNSSSSWLYAVTVAAAVGGVEIRKCVLTFSNGTDKCAILTNAGSPDHDMVISNNLIYGTAYQAMRLLATCANIIYANTVARCATGVVVVNGTASIKNNLVFCTTADYSGTFTGSNNGYSVGAPTGATGSVNLGTDEDAIFLDAGGSNFHVHGGCAADAAGTDLSADASEAITDDAEGDPRPTVPCLGSDELVDPVVRLENTMREALQPRVSAWSLSEMFDRRRTG